MKQSYFAEYNRVEKNNWWLKGRKNIICRLLDSTEKNERILDVGCSTGALLNRLRQLGFTNLWGLDISEKAIRLAEARHLTNLHMGDAVSTPYDDAFFDVVIASDILEHIKDDVQALSEWNRILKPDGLLLVFVPAFMFLWSAHDVVNHHYRRYTAPTLADRVRASGFTITKLSYWNSILFFPAAIARRGFSKSRDIASFHEIPSIVNILLTYLLRFENTMLAHMDAPFGVSVFAVASKGQE